MLRRALPDEADKAADVMRAELQEYLRVNNLTDAGFWTPSGGALEAEMREGKCVVYLDDADPRTVVHVLLTDPLFVSQVWGDSTKHAQILESITDVLIAEGMGDRAVAYPRMGTPLTKIADEKAVSPGEIRGSVAVTTARKAKARLRAARGAR